MAPYLYSKLNIEAQEIRLLTLIPGTLFDPIRITISHHSFLAPKVLRSSSVLTAAHRKGLPADWYVFETLEGRIL